MVQTVPTAELDARFSSEGARPTAWPEARKHLETAELYWLTTVRADGRPHVTPLIAVWLDAAMYFCTGASEQKAKNLEHNRHCILTTGRNSLTEGLDLVVEGDAVRMTDEAKLRRIAAAYESKYGREWHFDVRDRAFVHADGGRDHVALCSRLTPRKRSALARANRTARRAGASRACSGRREPVWQD
jgi:general stress protein 26